MHVCMLLQRHRKSFLLVKRRLQAPTSAFGAVVLCELPNAVQSESLPRFLEGAT